MKELALPFASFLLKSRRLRLCLAFMACSLVLEHFSIAWMAESRVIERLMGGAIPSVGLGLLVFGFILLRVTATLLLPGLLLSCLLSDALDFFGKRRQDSAKRAEER